MTVKFYTAKSSAVRALKKAQAGYEAFIASAVPAQNDEGHYGSIVLKAGAGRHLGEFMEERGMMVAFLPSVTEEQAAAQPMGEKDLPAEAAADKPGQAIDLEADADDLEAEEADAALVAAHLAQEFAAMFAAEGGNAPRGRCKALRAVAAAWEGSRKEFIDAAVAHGIMPGTANANYQAGYKG